MRTCLVVLTCLGLQGCWFIYIPGGLFRAGNSCVSESAVVGQSIYNSYNGKTGKVKELHGRSDRCQSGATPILATVEYPD